MTVLLIRHKDERIAELEKDRKLWVNRCSQFVSDEQTYGTHKELSDRIAALERENRELSERLRDAKRWMKDAHDFAQMKSNPCCPGCGVEGEQECGEDCWVLRLEVAMGRAAALLSEKGEKAHGD